MPQIIRICNKGSKRAFAALSTDGSIADKTVIRLNRSDDRFCPEADFVWTRVQPLDAK